MRVSGLSMWFFDTDWKAEVFKRIDALSEKLGIAAGHLWQVLVRQAIAEAVASIVLVVLCVVGIIVAVKIIRWAAKFGEANKDNYSREWPPRAIVWTAISLVSLAVTIPGVFVNLYEAVMYLINPEYFALQRILELFGK